MKGYKTIKTTLGHKIRVKMSADEIAERQMFCMAVIVLPLITSAAMFFLWVKVGG